MQRQFRCNFERKGKRPNKAQPITCEEESALWTKAQVGDHAEQVLTNKNFHGHQEHHDA